MVSLMISVMVSLMVCFHCVLVGVDLMRGGLACVHWCGVSSLVVVCACMCDGSVMEIVRWCDFDVCAFDLGGRVCGCPCVCMCQ